jgi:hypothetical protein
MSWAALQDHVLAAVQHAAPEGVRVFVSEAIDLLPSREQFAPAVHIIYQGLRVNTSDPARASNARAADIACTFDLVACCRSAAAQGGTDPARHQAAMLCETLTRRLMGRAIVPGDVAPFGRLILTGAEAPVASAAGYVYVGASFEARTMLYADKDYPGPTA